FMVMLGLFQALLARWSGQRDVVVGTPLAGRSDPQMEPLVGFFVNMLPIRVTFDGDPDALTAIARARAASLDAFADQDLPFDKLVEALAPVRQAGRTPIFQIGFALQDGLRDIAASSSGVGRPLPELATRPVELSLDAAKFDLMLHIGQVDGALRGRAEYATDLFDGTTVHRLVRQLVTLLSGAIAEPTRSLRTLPLLDAAARHQQQIAWNDNPRLSAPWTPAGVPGLISRWSELGASRPAVISGGETLRYGALIERASQLAHHLRALDLGCEDRVAVLLPRTSSLIVAQLAVLFTGAAYVPLDAAHTPHRLAFTIRDSRAKLVLTLGPMADDLLGTLRGWHGTDDDPRPALPAPQVIALDRDAALWAERPPTPPAVPPPRPQQLAYVIYTSGSTGRPKGVGVAHASLWDLIVWNIAARDLDESDRGALIAGLAFDATVWEIWPLLAAGGALLLPDEEIRADARKLRDWLLHEEATVTFVPTPLAEQLLTLAWPSDAPLRALLTGGDRLRHRPPARGVPPLWNYYGPTEATVVATGGRVRPASAPGVDGRDRAPSIGRPRTSMRVYVLDPALRPLPLGVPGELCLGGEVPLARGYLDRPSLTAAAFVPDPHGGGRGQRLYRTGDRVRWRADGRLHFEGRLDHQVKLRGFRIELGEIEMTLVEQPSVEMAVALLREDVPGDPRLVAYVVPSSALSIFAADLPSQLATALARVLPPYMVPSTFMVLEDLPLSASGKIDRRALPAPSLPGAGASYEPPRTPLEAQLVEAWSEALGRERVSIHDDFFVLGGHSLLATRLITHLRLAFGREDLPLRLLFEARTPAAFAAQLEAADPSTLAAAAPPIVPRARDDGERLLPLTFAQERAWFHGQLQPDSPAYNIPLALALDGPLDVDALRRALAAVIARHEVLRTTFAVDDALPAHAVPPPPAPGGEVVLDLDDEIDLDAEMALDLDAPLEVELDLAGDDALDAAADSASDDDLGFDDSQTGIVFEVEFDDDEFADAATADDAAPAADDVPAARAFADDPTRFGAPHQVIGPPPAPADALALIDLTALVRTYAEDAQFQLRQRDAERAFDLARGPLLRSRLLRLEPQRHVLLLNQHHAVSDGWSIGVLLRELSAHYEAFRGGRRPSTPVLPPLPVQVADVALWERGWLVGAARETLLDHWRAALAGVPPLALPTDRPRPPRMRDERIGGVLRFRLPVSTARGLHALSQRYGTTLFMTLMAGYQALLGRLAGQADFAVGTPVAGRDHAELQPLIGFFIRTVVLRASLTPDLPFTRLLEITRRRALDAFAHQDLPFEQIVADLGLSAADTGITPVFQVLLNVQNMDLGPGSLPGLEMRTLGRERQTMKFDLSLAWREAEDGSLHGTLGYDGALFDRTTLLRWSASLQRLLQHVATAPSTRLDALPLASAAERHAVRHAWARSVDHADRRLRPLTTQLRVWSNRTPSAPAVVVQPGAGA
ncbi:MAG: amino acid adenylation domain-containing protein, partial [Acidobacteriota bacterium]